MVVLRPTVKSARGLPAPQSIDAPSDGALGDWYINRVSIDRTPALLLVSSTSLLPILTPARAIATFPSRFPQVVRERLRRLGVPDHLIHAEVATLDPVHVGRTRNRSTVGILMEFTLTIPPTTNEPRLGSLAEIEAWLARVPCRASHRDCIWPDKKSLELLEARWGSAPPVPHLHLLR
jgi:hypothetical protein